MQTFNFFTLNSRYAYFRKTIKFYIGQEKVRQRSYEGQITEYNNNE